MLNTCKLISLTMVYWHHQCWCTALFVTNGDDFFTSNLQCNDGSWWCPRPCSWCGLLSFWSWLPPSSLWQSSLCSGEFHTVPIYGVVLLHCKVRNGGVVHFHQSVFLPRSALQLLLQCLNISLALLFPNPYLLSVTRVKMHGQSSHGTWYTTPAVSCAVLCPCDVPASSWVSCGASSLSSPHGGGRPSSGPLKHPWQNAEWLWPWCCYP